MAMKAMYNAGAQLSLAQMNKNITKAGNALARLSSGERIIGLQDDDSASFGISEKMREQIRSLLQDNQNVQNGSSMIKIAERGIDQIVQEISRLKEPAINAANDSNTDDDRRTIQKEFDSGLDTINDIAIGTTYNGKILFDGRWSRGGTAPLKSGGGGANTKLTNVVTAFKASYNATPSSKTESGTTYRGCSKEWRFPVDNGFGGSDFSVELDFSAMTTKESYPDTLNGQGFTILCGACPQYINIRFDSSLSAAQSKYDRTPGLASDNSRNDFAREFIIGVKDVTGSGDLAEAIFQGISAVSNNIEKSFTVYYYGTEKPFSQSGENKSSSHVNSSDDILVNAAHSLRIRRDPSNPSKILFTKASEAMLFKEGTIANPLIDPTIPAETKERQWNPLWVQHGTQSGQRIHVYINSMQTKDIGLDGVKVTTREKANDALKVIKGALETVLGEATNMGAYLQRLEYTDSNVTTMGESVQNAESVIRDVDMAREMAEYTKYNILTQSSQAMLAQANQNGSAILSLLQ